MECISLWKSVTLVKQVCGVWVCKHRSVSVLQWCVFCVCSVMGVKAQRPRCFFDVGISNVPGKTQLNMHFVRQLLFNFWKCGIYLPVIFLSRFSFLQRGESSSSFSLRRVPRHVKTSAACAQVKKIQAVLFYKTGKLSLNFTIFNVSSFIYIFLYICYIMKAYVIFFLSEELLFQQYRQLVNYFLPTVNSDTSFDTHCFSAREVCDFG